MMQFPLQYIGITQGFHQGKSLDFGWHTTTTPPVYAVEDGTVLESQYETKSGHIIRIQHNNGMVSSYGHLSSRVVLAGNYVVKGQLLGFMGNTGTGANGEYHLHFGLYSKELAKVDYWHDADVDPFLYLHVLDTQEVSTSTLKKYPILFAAKGEENSMYYVYNVDEEGLNVRQTPNGLKSGEVLQTATEVVVYEMSGSWSKIGENRWVFGAYLSKNKPVYYEVSGADSEGLNVRNKPSVSGKILNTIKNGHRVQIYEVRGSWAKVSKTEERWCSKKYLTLKK